MAHLTIRLRVDAATGKKDVVVSYQSDADALPVEHEEDHRRLVEKLIEGGALAAGELGTIVVEREAPAVVGEAKRGEAPHAEREKVKG